jgi:hypothetical protein
LDESGEVAEGKSVAEDGFVVESGIFVEDGFGGDEVGGIGATGLDGSMPASGGDAEVIGHGAETHGGMVFEGEVVDVGMDDDTSVWEIEFSVFASDDDGVGQDGISFADFCTDDDGIFDGGVGGNFGIEDKVSIFVAWGIDAVEGASGGASRGIGDEVGEVFAHAALEAVIGPVDVAEVEDLDRELIEFFLLLEGLFELLHAGEEIRKVGFEAGDAGEAKFFFDAGLASPGGFIFAVKGDPEVWVPVNLALGGFEGVAEGFEESLDGVEGEGEAAEIDAYGNVTILEGFEAFEEIIVSLAGEHFEFVGIGVADDPFLMDGEFGGGKGALAEADEIGVGQIVGTEVERCAGEDHFIAPLDEDTLEAAIAEVGHHGVHSAGSQFADIDEVAGLRADFWRRESGFAAEEFLSEGAEAGTAADDHHHDGDTLVAGGEGGYFPIAPRLEGAEEIAHRVGLEGGENGSIAGAIEDGGGVFLEALEPEIGVGLVTGDDDGEIRAGVVGDDGFVFFDDGLPRFAHMIQDWLYVDREAGEGVGNR